MGEVYTHKRDTSNAGDGSWRCPSKRRVGARCPFSEPVTISKCFMRRCPNKAFLYLTKCGKCSFFSIISRRHRNCDTYFARRRNCDVFGAQLKKKAKNMQHLPAVANWCRKSTPNVLVVSAIKMHPILINIFE